MFGSGGGSRQVTYGRLKKNDGILSEEVKAVHRLLTGNETTTVTCHDLQ